MAVYRRTEHIREHVVTRRHALFEIDFYSDLDSVMSTSTPHRCSCACGYSTPFQGRGGDNVGYPYAILTLGKYVYVL